jgi:EAL domain-containing protein (putative c-di-GMP-specific phosphodiesterase class I)
MGWIARSLRRRLVDRNPVNRELVEATHKVARVMGMKTVAEWAESEGVLKMLKDIGIDYAQGYLLAQPVPLDSLAASGQVCVADS